MNDGNPPGAASPRSVLGLLLPLRADPAILVDLVERYQRDVLPARGEPDAEERWRLVEAVLRSAGATGGLLPPSQWRREPAGRLHATEPAAQCIPGFVRPAFQPNGLFIDADFVAAHPTIAAARSGDLALARDIASHGYYEGLAGEVVERVRGIEWAEGVGATHLRSAIKRVVCAFVNGGGAGTVRLYLGRVYKNARKERGEAAPGGLHLRGILTLAQWFYTAWWSRYPVLSAWGTAVARSWQPGVSVVRTMTGRELRVPAVGLNGWRTLLSAQWSSVEAEAMDHLLSELTGNLLGGGVVLPMFDGVLLDVPTEHAETLAGYTEAVLRWAMEAAGVGEVGVKVQVQRAWGVSGAET